MRSDGNGRPAWFSSFFSNFNGALLGLRPSPGRRIQHERIEKAAKVLEGLDRGTRGAEAHGGAAVAIEHPHRNGRPHAVADVADRDVFASTFLPVEDRKLAP